MRSPIDAHGERVTAAVESLGRDPNLAGEKTIRMLKWKESDSKPFELADWMRELVEWLGDFFGWFAQSGRYVVWILALLAVGALVIFLYRRLRDVDLRPRQGFKPPSHVRDLDIRPESLPDDIGAAALALWQRGEKRAALALLYRGLLSRLAHVHAVPIRDSSTEGDCQALATRHAPRSPSDYAHRLIPVWQRAVYGAQAPADAVVAGLCESFASALDAVRQSDASRSPA